MPKEIPFGNAENPDRLTRKNNSDLGGRSFDNEQQTTRGSCFPVNIDLTRRVLTDLSVGKGMNFQRAEKVAPVLNSIAEQSPALMDEAFTELVEMQAAGVEETIPGEYLLGLATGYNVLKEQAEKNDARFPSVSQEIIDSFARDVWESLQGEEDALAKFLERVQELEAEDPGFVSPLKEYAPDPEYDFSQFNFLASAIDTYERVKRAEVSDKMIRDMGIGEN